MAKPIEKNKGGRPTDYTNEKASVICDRIINGESVHSICKDDLMPCRATIHRWLIHNKEFSDQYTQALQQRTHLLAEERHDILNDAIDQLSNLPEGVNANVFGNLIKEKMRIIEWDAERLAPKKYKPKSDTDEPQNQKPVTLNFYEATKTDVENAG